MSSMREDLQMAYNAVCCSLWHLDRTKDESDGGVVSDIVDGIFTDLDRIRERLAPIAWPVPHG